MDILISAYLLIIGLALGSFTLAMADRMNKGKDWVRGRSECDKCKKKLQPIDLVPVFSWLSTGGKCRYCKVKLSYAYPLTELSLGLALVVSYVFWPVELSGVALAQFAVWVFALVLMCGLFVFDVRWYLLPNKLVYPLIGLGVAWAFLDIYDKGFSAGLLLDIVLAIVVGAGLFLFLFLVSKGAWIGDGDIRFGVAIGLFTGVWTVAWLTLFVASVIGLLIAVPVLLASKNKKKSKLKLKVPFGPMLIVALYISVLFGSRLIDWYSTNFLLL